VLNVRSLDDRRRPVRLTHAGMLAAASRWRASLGPVTPRRLPRLARRVVLTGPFLAFVGACAVFSILAKLISEDLSTGLGLMIFSPVAVPLITLALTTGRGVLGLGGSLPSRMRRAMLASHRCPACGYDLRGAEPGPDGLIICPECAAAWLHAQTGPGADAPHEVIIVDWNRPAAPPR
jgi:hypothetical protein